MVCGVEGDGFGEFFAAAVSYLALGCGNGSYMDSLNCFAWKSLFPSAFRASAMMELSTVMRPREVLIVCSR